MKKIIALHLPQYHSFKENDAWWGEGFTEWTCVNRAYSRAVDHKIKKPHPDIGYYSLLDNEARKQQGNLAKLYGVDGFCYYHYWFGDRVLMDKPLQLMLDDGQPDLPFCLSWANEPWTRRMNGGNGELLQPNNYGGVEEWRSHLAYLLPFFHHPNYICIDNKPVFVIYRCSQIPQFSKRLAYWREELQKLGFNGLYVVMTIGNFSDNYKEMCQHVDATFDFYPNFLWDPHMISKIEGDTAFYDMRTVYDRIANTQGVHENHFYGTMVGFDSSPRSPKRCNVFLNGSPKLFEVSLDTAIQKSGELVFVNAWNEWGEGCALEPEESDGYGYLEAVRRATGRHKIKLC